MKLRIDASAVILRLKSTGAGIFSAALASSAFFFSSSSVSRFPAPSSPLASSFSCFRSSSPTTLSRPSVPSSPSVVWIFLRRPSRWSSLSPKNVTTSPSARSRRFTSAGTMCSSTATVVSSSLPAGSLAVELLSDAGAAAPAVVAGGGAADAVFAAGLALCCAKYSCFRFASRSPRRKYFCNNNSA